MTGDPDVRRQLLEWFPGRVEVVPFAAAVAVVGIWWVVLGMVLRRFRRTVKVAFSPFADWFGRGHAIRISLTGLLLAAASFAVVIRMYGEP